ncbi:LysR substrate-binding domain-containing protein [Actinoplanes sp. L3-i22]|uniref:LysR substrate-binding domain-containing protein n=1 Tax=Actinoplanes sp. L3-i22 TaxID=2836373 RepID=UPI001C7466A5|nr:LysR substrate-binding domain-containing protein [Actinoplanes sp. L3-i22]BCY09227.1 LysR family transcriptional regulator [Actinoplanes sp. L3-i22]
MLKTHRLHLLVALAQTGSIASAARSLGCSAAAASEQLTALEQDTGAQLLERRPRSVRLTAAGELLVEHARRILADLETAAQAVAAAGAAGQARLRVGAFATAARRLAVPALATLRRRHPRLQLSFVEIEPEAALPAVRAGEIDLAVTHRYAGFAEPDLRALTQVPLFTEPLVLAVPAGLGPVEGSAVKLGAYAAADWVANRADQGFQAVTETAARLAGFEPRITCRVDSYHVVLDLVAAGMGVALVPRTAAAPRSGLRLLTVSAPRNLARNVQMTTRTADHSPAVAELSRELTRRAATIAAAKTAAR